MPPQDLICAIWIHSKSWAEPLFKHLLFKRCSAIYGSQDIILGIVSRPRTGWPRNHGSILNRGKFFLSFKLSILGLGPPSLLFHGCGGSFPLGKVVGACSWPFLSSAKINNEWSYTATAAMFMSFAGFDRVPGSSHLELCLQLGLVTPRFLNKILCVFLISPNRAVCPLSHPYLCNKGKGRVEAFIIIFSYASSK